MILFDEKQLLQKLEQLARSHRVAFAAACAQRQLLSYQRFSAKTGFGDFAALENMLESLWKELNGNPMPEKELAAKIDAGMQLIAGEDIEEDGREYAEDAAAAVVYALRCRQNGESQEAMYTARRAYESLDHFVINTENMDTNRPGEEARVLSHPLIQSEFGRQLRDLDELQRGTITVPELQARARKEAVEFLPVINGE
jgi:uncharacterized protein YjaG (DUF416 family)